jgi:hypothetical protein
MVAMVVIIVVVIDDIDPRVHAIDEMTAHITDDEVLPRGRKRERISAVLSPRPTAARLAPASAKVGKKPGSRKPFVTSPNGWLYVASPTYGVVPGSSKCHGSLMQYVVAVGL